MFFVSNDFYFKWSPYEVIIIFFRSFSSRHLIHNLQEFFVSVKGISASENQVAEITNETDGRKVDPSKTDITPGMQGEEEHNKLSGKETAL